MIARLVK